MVRVRKIALLGFPAVGKSSLAQQFVSGKFDEDYTPTINEKLIASCKFSGQDYEIHLYDSMGVTEQGCFPDDYLVADGWVLVFSVTARRSFEVIQDIYAKIREAGARKRPIMIVGNKTDLVSERVVTSAEAEQVAKNIGAQYIESSARKNFHVRDIFGQLVLQMEKSSNDPTTAEGCCIL